jgi:hypothetical protein
VEDHRPQLLAEHVGHTYKFFELFVALDVDFLVCDRARDLQREDETGWRFELETINSLDRRTVVEGRIHFNVTHSTGET